VKLKGLPEGAVYFSYKKGGKKYFHPKNAIHAKRVFTIKAFFGVLHLSLTGIGGVEPTCPFGRHGRWGSQWRNQPTYFHELKSKEGIFNEKVISDNYFNSLCSHDHFVAMLRRE
jgi:hypothetical protein